MKSPTPWLETLRDLVHARPIVIFRFSSTEWMNIAGSRRGESRFTVARPHDLFHNVRVPTLCLIFTEEFLGKDLAYAGLLSACGTVTTLESRATIESVRPVLPTKESQLLGVVNDRALRRILGKRVEERAPVIRLSPALSKEIVTGLSTTADNHAALSAIVESLGPPKRFTSNVAVQGDAVHTALKIFGLATHEPALFVDVIDNRLTALSRIRVLEDAIIEHNARSIPSFNLVSSDIAGRAVFQNGADRLEVITANKRPLEESLGVDLIYVNVPKQNVVMVQYKMLEPVKKAGEPTDWIYRPDDQLAKELERMKRFAESSCGSDFEYRLNSQVFYLKFVRRDAVLSSTTVTMPIDHYEVLRRDPSCKGPKGGFRVSYDSLGGRYLRQEAFIDLIRSGYIGAHAKKTEALREVIQSILEGNQALVAAYQFQPPRGP